MTDSHTLHKTCLVFLICCLTLLVNNLLYVTIIPALIFIIALSTSVILFFYHKKIASLLLYGYALLIFFPYHFLAFNSYHSIGIWNWVTTPLGFIGLIIYASALWLILPGKTQLTSQGKKMLRLLIVLSIAMTTILVVLLLMWNRLL